MYGADQRLNLRVKAALIGTPELSAAAIDVDSKNRVVTLGGFVDNGRQRREAGTVARNVEGVTRVINRIEVK